MPRQEEQLNFDFKQEFNPAERESEIADPAAKKVEANRRRKKIMSPELEFHQDMLNAFDKDKEWPKKVFWAVQSNPNFYLSESDERITKSILQDRDNYVKFGSKKRLVSMCKKISEKLIK